VSTPMLKAKLQDVAGTAYADVNLTDVSLLTVEAETIAAEERAFGPELVRWPLVGVEESTFLEACFRANASKAQHGGCDVNAQPEALSDEVRKAMAESFTHWDVDNLTSKVEALRAMLLSYGHAQTPGIVLFHCNCGCDRTGMLAAAYSMRYLAKTFTEAMGEAEQIAGRQLVYRFQVGAQWYCESLLARGLYYGYDCGNCAPFRCADSGDPMDPRLVWDLRCATIFVAALLFVAALRLRRWCSRRRKRLAALNSYSYKELPSSASLA